MNDKDTKQSRAKEPGMPPKPEPMGDLPPELAPSSVKIEPPPGKPKVDNTEAEAAVQFLKAGAPLQEGTPDNPNKLLAQIQKANR